MRAYPVFQFCASICCVRLVASVRRDFFLTFLDLLTAIYRAIYVNLRKNNTHKISRIFRTECQKSFRSYVHQHACVEKCTYFYICLLKKWHACTRKKKFIGLLLDLSAKDTTIEQDINMHARENNWN